MNSGLVALLVVVLANAPRTGLAQSSNKAGRVAILSGISVALPPAAPLFRAFMETLRAKGWEEGRNLTLDARHTDGQAELFGTRAAEIVASSPDVIVATNSQAVAATMARTTSTPIVMIDVSHPVEAGFVKSLSSPGLNVTGVTNQGKDIAIKHYDLLREINPHLERVGLLFTPSNAGSALGMKEQMAVAQQAGLSLILIPLEKPADLDDAERILKQKERRRSRCTPRPYRSGTAPRLQNSQSKVGFRRLASIPRWPRTVF